MAIKNKIINAETALAKPMIELAWRINQSLFKTKANIVKAAKSET